MFTNFKQFSIETFMIFMFVPLLFFACSSQDLEFIQPYQFINKDFESIAELPPLEEEEPVIQEPERSEVTNSNAIEPILPNLSSATSEDDIDETAKEFLANVSDFVVDLDDDTEELLTGEARNLNSTAVDQLLGEGVELNNGILQIAILAAESSPVSSLFPSLVLPQLPDLLINPSGRLTGEDEFGFDLDFEFVRVSTLVGSCAVAANQAYDEALGQLNNQRAIRIETANQNLNRRVAEAEARLLSRDQAALDEYRASLTTLRENINNNIDAANNLQTFSPELADNLRYYTLLYSYYYKYIIDLNYDFYLEYHERLRDNEVAIAGILLQQSLKNINNDYNMAKSNLDNVLQTSLNNCHNQGSGN